MFSRIIDALAEQSVQRAGQLFVEDERKALSYGDFYAGVLSVAAALHAKGVKYDDKVALVIQYGMDHLMSYFACQYIGAVPVHLSVQRARRNILSAAEVSDVRYVLTQLYSEDLSEGAFTVLDFDTLTGDLPPAPPVSNDLAYMMFTSGTTGAPKAVLTTHSNTMATASSILDFTKMTENDRELISLSLAFTFGLGHIHALILAGGQAFVTHRRYEQDYLTRAITAQKASGFLASPTMLREMLRDECEALESARDSLRYIVVNCTPMEPQLTQALLELLPQTQIYMYYGMTEASRCAYIHYNANRHRLDFTGRNCLNVQLKIDQPDAEGVGVICMRGPNVMPAYYKNSEATARIIDAEQWIHSGDLGIMDEDGYVKVLGRMNDQISVDGMKCQPAEVEDLIRQLPFVEQVAACPLSDPDKFQVVAVAIQPEGELPLDFEQIILQQCSANLEAYKVPVVIEVVEKIPANELGKINRRQVAELLGARKNLV